MTETFQIGKMRRMSTGSRKLAAWLEREGIKMYVFAARVGVGPSTITRLLNGDRRPGLDLAGRIFAETGGDVTHNDWITPIKEMSENAAA